MFHFTRDISVAAIRANSLNFHKCLRHKVFFNPVNSCCPSCGYLQTIPALSAPNQSGGILNWPYTVPYHPGMQAVPYYPGQVITTDGTIYNGGLSGNNFIGYASTSGGDFTSVFGTLTSASTDSSMLAFNTVIYDAAERARHEADNMPAHVKVGA